MSYTFIPPCLQNSYSNIERERWIETMMFHGVENDKLLYLSCLFVNTDSNLINIQFVEMAVKSFIYP